MNDTLTIDLVPETGGSARFTFTKTGRDTGDIALRTWHPGVAVAGPADAELDASVYGLATDPGFSHVRCKTDHRVLLFTVTLTLDVTLAAGDPPVLALSLSPDLTGGGETRYTVSRQDRDRLVAFLRSAAFPPLQP